MLFVNGKILWPIYKYIAYPVGLAVDFVGRKFFMTAR